MIIFNKLDNYFIVSADRQTFFGFEMTANFHDTSPLSGPLHTCTYSKVQYCCISVRGRVGCVRGGGGFQMKPSFLSLPHRRSFGSSCEGGYPVSRLQNNPIRLKQHPAEVQKLRKQAEKSVLLCIKLTAQIL